MTSMTMSKLVIEKKQYEKHSQGNFDYVVVPAHMRTITLSTRYGALDKTEFYVLVPPTIFARRQTQSDNRYNDHLTGVIFGDKCYHAPFPNMFGFGTCVNWYTVSVEEHASMFWQSLFGPQRDALFGLMEWFGDTKMQKEAKGYDNHKRHSGIDSSHLFHRENPNNASVVALQIWENISKEPNALEILKQIAEKHLQPFTVEQFCV